MISVININIDPILWHIGSFSLHWYGVMYVVAFFVAYKYAALPHLLRHGFDREFCTRLLTWTIICGLIGARLFFVIQQPNLGDYFKHPIDIIAVWQGGMAFFGAVIGGVGCVAVVCLRNKKSFWVCFDAAVLFAVVGQPIGRIGNIINGDILGNASNLPWATAYQNPNAVLQSCCQLGVAYQPAAAYEALGTIVIGLFLFWLRRRGVRDGVLGITYVGAYAISQFLIFFLRNSEPVIGFGLKQAQWTAIVMFVLIVPGLILIWKRTNSSTLTESKT